MFNNEKIGLVLGGGGAKGAFQVGAWKAICELGLAEQISVISGTSVGAINGAAIAGVQKNASALETLWRESITKIVVPNYLELITKISTIGITIEVVKALFGNIPYSFPALLDSSKLEEILTDCIPEKWPSSLQVHATALCHKRGFYSLKRFKLSAFSKTKRVQRIMASAAFPIVFSPVKIEGETYVDGGWEERGGDNLPIKPILQDYPDIKKIIAIRCAPAELQSKLQNLKQNVEVIEIAPIHTLQGPLHPYIDTWQGGLFDKWKYDIESLSGVIAFQSEYIANYISQGYDAARRILWPYLLNNAHLQW